MQMVLIALIVVGIDQLGKYYVQAKLAPGMSIPVIGDVFHITYVLNPGAAFGILQNQTYFFLAVVALLFLAVIAFYRWIPTGHFWLRTGIALQLGGAAGNFIDRVKTGYVVDFFDFRIWPVFNVADIAIVVGVAMIVYDLLYLSNKEVPGSE